MREMRIFQRLALGLAILVLAAMPVMAQQMAPTRFQVFFDWDQYVLTPEAKKTLEAAAAEFKKTGVTQIEAVGHTDTTGSKEYNLRLSERRAQSVKAELVRLGIPAGVITTKGVGFSQLLVPTGPGVRELKNRRVEIYTVTPPAKPIAAAPAPAPAPVAPPPPPAPKKWSATLGPWYGYSLKENDRNSDLTANLVGAQATINYAIAPEWLVGIDVAGFNTIGTSVNDGWGGRFGAQFAHVWNLGKWHPYIGPTVGYIAGAGVQDGGFAGPRVGVKYDVSDAAFLYAQVGYDKLFRNDFGRGVINGGIGGGIRF